MWISVERYGIHVYILYKHLEKIKYIVEPYLKCREIDNDNELKADSWKIVLSYNITNKNKVKKIDPIFFGDKEPKRTYYVDESKKIVFIDKPESEDFKVQIAVRLARDIIKHILMNNGYCFLHGGMIELQGKGVCFLGDKMHGKTSLLLSSLAIQNGKYVTNDDVTLCNSDGFLQGVGWPRAISVRKDSLERMNNILCKFDFTQNLTHPDNYIDQLNGSFFYYVNELTNILNCTICTEKKIDFFLNLQFTNENFYVRKASEKEKIMVLQRYVDNEVSKYFIDFKPYFGECINELSEKMVNKIKNIPMYFLNQNLNKMNEVQEWLKEIIK